MHVHMTWSHSPLGPCVAQPFVAISGVGFRA